MLTQPVLDSPRHFLTDPPRHLFFTGKGGVGKTSVACASAIALAKQGRRVLLVSTDPASNVAQVFSTSIGNTVTPIPGVAGLSALEINPDEAAAAYREKIIGPVRSLLPQKEIELITEQLSGSCTTEIASFNEFTGLLADPALTADFDHVLFDTAPTGHTLRLLQLPGSWTDFLDAGKGDASCLGPMSGLERNRATYRAAVSALTDPDVTRIVLVARPQRATLVEVARARRELAELGIPARHLVINAILPRDASVDDDPLARALSERERHVLADAPPELRGVTVDELPLRPVNMVGIAALEGLLDPGSTADAGGTAPRALPGPEPLRRLVDELEARGHGLIMTMGKGGVGKTTIAASIALALAQRGHQVHLTTTDPAAHLTATLNADVANLTVDAIDPEAATEAYRERILASKGRNLDAAGRAALREDLLSPCTEEIAVFQQFSRAVNRAREQFVVVDTAPTGHTLLLMDATGSYHRDIVRHLDDEQRGRTTTPLMRLQDPEHTAIIVVTLPETTPVLEAEQLTRDLGRAGITPWGWVINNSLSAAGPTSPVLTQRAATEADPARRVHELCDRVATVPTQRIEPTGPAALAALLG